MVWRITRTDNNLHTERVECGGSRGHEPLSACNNRRERDESCVC